VEVNKAMIVSFFKTSIRNIEHKPN
jgi:hypothetical protein